MRVITIKSYPSMPWRFEVEEVNPKKKYARRRDACSLSEAAAVAIEYANDSYGCYCIVGIDGAVSLIPENLRNGNSI